MSRLENSAKNIALSFGNNLLSSVLGFIGRTVFIYTLGTDYLGLAGLLGNVLGFLSISELGIASAIGFSLYKPLANKDYRSVSALMTIYRKAYAVIGGIVLFSGMVLFFFLDFFIPESQQPAGTEFAYFIFLINMVVGYFLSYKSTLISSDNQSFRLVPTNMIMTCVQCVLQISVLLCCEDYLLYLVVQLCCSIISMAWQNAYITKVYKEVSFYSDEKLTDGQRLEIKKNISGLVVAKIGDYLVNSTDNLIITKLISLSATGIYSNYLLLRNMVNGYISTVFSGITAGMGNVVAIENDKRKLELFDTMMFCAFFIYAFEASCFMCLFNPFIDIWIGKAYTFGAGTVAIIVLNNYLTGLRIPLITMKGAAGKYLEDAWIPFAFAGINLLASIVLARHIGVAGVFLGTIVGSLLTADWYRPIVIYRTVFHAPVRLYYKKYVCYVFLGIAYVTVAYGVSNLVTMKNIYINFFIRAVVANIIPVLFNIFLFRKTREFLEIKAMALRLLTKVRSKKTYNK